MKKYAYLIMAHGQFDQLYKLIKSLDDKNNEIFIHIDKKNHDFNHDIENLLISAGTESSVYVYNEVKVYWSHFSQVECELFLLEKAVTKGPFEYYHLISGQDYPIKSQYYIQSFFSKNSGKEFIDYQTDFFEKNSQLILNRIMYYHPFRKYCRFFKYRILNDLFRCLDKTSLLIQKIMRVDRCKKNKLDICFGANWFSITDGFAKYILNNKEFIEKNFKYSNCPDELFVQTLLKTSPYIKNLYHETTDDFYGNMRLVDFHRGNPYTYCSSDIEEIKKSKYIFVRKIDERLDKRIISLIEESFK